MSEAEVEEREVEAHRHDVGEHRREDGAHLAEVADGAGCTEIWEHLSEEREE